MVRVRRRRAPGAAARKIVSGAGHTSDSWLRIAHGRDHSVHRRSAGKAPRRARRETAECIEIVEANLRLTLDLYGAAPPDERPVRARQLRQLAELLEYIVAGEDRTEKRA